jgi:hypothetical protein
MQLPAGRPVLRALLKKVGRVAPRATAAKMYGWRVAAGVDRGCDGLLRYRSRPQPDLPFCFVNAPMEQLRVILDTSEPALLGPQTRDSALPLDVARKRITGLLDEAGISGTAAELILSLGLLWHDHLDASHAICQAVHSVDGSYVHGILHRREPDFGNAAYWFRRVGEHAIHPKLSREVTALPSGAPCRERLIGHDRWNPLAMVDACEAVEVEAADVMDADFLRQVQAIEFRLLLEHFCGPSRV